MAERTADYFSPNFFVQACETSGMPRRRIAEALAISPRTLRNVISGRAAPSMTLLKRAVDVLGGELVDYLALPPREKWNLQHLRLAYGYSQRAVAEWVGISQAMVSNWEAGNYAPSADAVAKLAALYRIPQQRIREVIAMTAATADAERQRATVAAATFGLVEEVLAYAKETTDLARSAEVGEAQRGALYVQIRDRAEEALLLVGTLIPQLAPMRRADAYRQFTRLRSVYEEVSGTARTARRTG
jgi:transcriptional regulator with XRE-family HTH domain